MKSKSKLPKDIRKSLAKQMKILFTGKIESVKINLNLNLPIKVGYGWGEDASAQYNVQPGDNHIVSFNALLQKKIEETMQPKIDKVNNKIVKFYNRLDKVCKKYNSLSDEEFYIIYDEFKLNNCCDNWK